MARYQTNNLLGIGLIGYVIWLDIPSTEVWTGAVIIIGCGLYVIHRESLHHRARARSGG